MNDSQRDDLHAMIRQYEEDMRRYIRQNPNSNAGNQFTGNMPSCGSQSGPINTGIQTGNPSLERRLPDATPPIRIPDASAPVEAAGSPQNRADSPAGRNRSVDFVREPVPNALPPRPMDEEEFQLSGQDLPSNPANNSGDSDGRIPLSPLYPLENRVMVPSGQRVNRPTAPTAEPGFRQNPFLSADGGQGTAFEENLKTIPTSGNTRKQMVPLPLAVGNVGVRPAIPTEQNPWGPTSAEPPAQSESSQIPAQTRAPQYADRTATTPNTPTGDPLSRQLQNGQQGMSLREQNIAEATSENQANPGMEQNRLPSNLSVAPQDAFTIPSMFRSGEDSRQISQNGAAVTPQLLQDLESASQLLTEEEENFSVPGIENFPGQSAQRLAGSGSGRESILRPNDVYQTESDYPVREQEDWESDEATITVYAYTARQGLPVPNADVTISRVFEGRPVLHFFTITDISGETEPRAVPAPPREWTQAPGYEHPYASYSIQVDAPGYYTVENINVPVFGGEASIQPVEMIPIPENERFIREKLVRESEPADL